MEKIVQVVFRCVGEEFVPVTVCKNASKEQMDRICEKFFEVDRALDKDRTICYEWQERPVSEFKKLVAMYPHLFGQLTELSASKI